MVALPAVIPETVPVDEPMVATAGLLLNHVPPPASDNEEVVPGHAFGVPLIGAGAADGPEDRRRRLFVCSGHVLSETAGALAFRGVRLIPKSHPGREPA